MNEDIKMSREVTIEEVWADYIKATPWLSSVDLYDSKPFDVEEGRLFAEFLMRRVDFGRLCLRPPKYNWTDEERRAINRLLSPSSPIISGPAHLGDVLLAINEAIAVCESLEPVGAAFIKECLGMIIQGKHEKI